MMQELIQKLLGKFVMPRTVKMEVTRLNPQDGELLLIYFEGATEVEMADINRYLSLYFGNKMIMIVNKPFSAMVAKPEVKVKTKKK